MEELLQSLEIKLKQLIAAHQGIKQSKRVLVHRNDELLVKQQAAITQIKKLVSQLKDIENDHDR